MIYGYIRVSTEEQTVENQRLVIRKYCKYRKMKNVQWIAETISGAKAPEKRKLGALLTTVQPDDTIIATEISRFGRSMIMTMTVLQKLKKQGVHVLTIKENYDNRSDSIQCLMIEANFTLYAQIGRTLISQRTKEGLARKRAEGVVLGRQKGFIPGHWKLTSQCKYIDRQLRKGRSKNSLAKELGVEWYTVNTYIKLHMKHDLKKLSKQ